MMRDEGEFARFMRAELHRVADEIEPEHDLAHLRERIGRGPVLREQRRTSLVIMASATGRVDSIRLCEPECRDHFLIDLGLRGHGGRSAFRSTGSARVLVEWNATEYDVRWRRFPPSARACDQCGDDWQYRARPASAPPPEPTDAQLAARARFAARHRKQGHRRPSAAANDRRMT
jgi:hypothetical protein